MPLYDLYIVAYVHVQHIYIDTIVHISNHIVLKTQALTYTPHSSREALLHLKMDLVVMCHQAETDL